VSSNRNYRAINGGSFRFGVDSVRLVVHSPCSADGRPRTSLPIATIFSLDQVVMDNGEVHESGPPTHISTSGRTDK